MKTTRILIVVIGAVCNGGLTSVSLDFHLFRTKGMAKKLGYANVSVLASKSQVQILSVVRAFGTSVLSCVSV
jgi:hypothetical protein